MDNRNYDLFTQSDCSFDDDCGEITFGHIVSDKHIQTAGAYQEDED